MKHFLTLVLVISLGSAYAGGGWTQQKGKAYYKVSEWWIVASQHFTNTGQIDPNATTVLANTTFYGEYGITDRITGILFVPLFSHTHVNNQVSATTGQIIQGGEGEAFNDFIADTDVSIKYRLSSDQSPFATALTLTLGLPFGNNSAGRQGSLQTGDGEFNQMLRFDVSRSFRLDENFAGYGGLYSAFNNRSNDFSDEFRIGAELGVALKERFWLIWRYDIIESLQNGSSAITDGQSVFANNTEFRSNTFEAAYYISKQVGVSASIGTATSGSLIFADPSYSIGFFLDL